MNISVDNSRRMANWNIPANQQCKLNGYTSTAFLQHKIRKSCYEFSADPD